MNAKRMGTIGMAVGALALLAAAAPRDAEAALGLCSRTSWDALAACRNEARADFFTTLGKCNNERGGRVRLACRYRAVPRLKAAGRECGEQFAERQRVCRALGHAPYDPVVRPAKFVSPTAAAADPNPYFPLVPGTVYTYLGRTETITVTVTDQTKVILGIACTAVHDVVEEYGTVVEDTWDWYAQDTAKNVWYFGEIAQNFVDGDLVDIAGSWRAGVDMARPGIVMYAAPAVGQVYRQEFLLGEAEDVARVLSVTGTETVPAASCTGDCVVTREWTPLEPGAVERKYYAPGVGLVLEVDAETGARTELTNLVTPP